MSQRILYFSLLVLVSACIVGGKKSDNLPKSLGSNHEIVVVVDSIVWKGAVGEALRNIFSETLLTPQTERLFKLLKIQPDQLNHVLKRHHSLIFMTTLEQKNRANLTLKEWLSPEHIKDIQSNGQYIFQKYNLYARDQIGIFLAAENAKTLNQYLLDYGEHLRIIFNQRELKRWQSGLYKSQEQKLLGQNLHERHDYKLRIPNGYKLVKDEKNAVVGFTWLRQSEAEYDKHILLAYKSYEDIQETAQTAILAWRDELAQTHLFGDPDDPNSFIITETLEPPTFQNLNFHKHYAVLMRGLWRTNNYSAGGPFVSYFIVDENRGRLYYLEGFIQAPGLKKRNLLREVEAIILSFDP